MSNCRGVNLEAVANASGRIGHDGYGGENRTWRKLWANRFSMRLRAMAGSRIVSISAGSRKRSRTVSVALLLMSIQDGGMHATIVSVRRVSWRSAISPCAICSRTNNCAQSSVFVGSGC